MPEENTTALCPSCKNRMSIRKIAQATSEDARMDARKIIYHCAMCDIEIRHSARSTASTEKEAPGFAFVVRSMTLDFLRPACMD